MAQAAFAIPHLLGGEISQFAQGRFDKPDYRNSMRVCLNAFPVEIGAWTRRPGTKFAGTTRGGVPGRIIKFDFEQEIPYTIEFTDGKIRFRNGATLIATNDAQVVVAISAANPAVVQTTTATNWATGDTLIFNAPSAALLENRQFLATKIDTTHFSLADAITGAAIDGATLGALAVGTTVSRVQELTTLYVGGIWSGVRAVQAETTSVLLQATIPPQMLTVPTLPLPGANALFAINPVLFQDGPYLDPFTNGVQVNPAGTSGIVQMTLSFQPYDATVAYPVGAFVTSVAINYVSLVDQNIANTPASSPLAWAPSNTNAAINNGQGILGTDVGRLIRLFSEPALWNVATTYSIGNVVSYNPSGLPGATIYYQSLTGSNTGFAPGIDLTHWQIVPQGAIWTWGKITGLSTGISGSLAGSTQIGSMTGNGGLAAAFNGNLAQPSATSASVSFSFFGGPTVQASGFVGKNYTGASAQKIASGTYYPSADLGYNHAFVSGTATPNLMTINLRASNSPPANAADGTLLGTTSFTSNNTTAVSITSSDQVTSWNYVWFEHISNWTAGPFPFGTYTIYCGQAVFFAPSGTGTGNGFSVEILGAKLLYTQPIRTWRLGLYSNTTGYPAVGAYYEGRIWLSGAVANRFDASVSNGITGSTINFAPTDQYGTVAPSSAISEVLNSDSVNPIFWMEPDLQGLILGTQAGEYLVVAPTSGAIAPNNIAARRVTKIGCANIEPRRTEHTTVFVQRYSQKLMEYFPDVYSGKFSAPNLADKAQHLTSKGIAELAYTSAVTPIIWGRDTAGSLFGITYKRDSLASAQPPTFYGWNHHALGSGRVVESICGGPSVGGNLDTLTMVTNDPLTGIRHVEVLTDTQDELAPLASAWFLDDAVLASSVDTSNIAGVTLRGLWHLNGKTVQIFASGLDLGDPGEGNAISDFVVSNGSVFVPYGDSISAGPGRGLFTTDFVAANPKIVVGFTYNSDGQLMHMIAQADSGARNGPAFGVLSRAHRFAVKLVNSFGLSFGARLDQLIPAIFKTDAADPIPPLTTFSGLHQDSLLSDEAYDEAFSWRVSRPWPATVVAAGNNLATQDQ